MFLILLSVCLTVTKNSSGQALNLVTKKTLADTICPKVHEVADLIHNRDILIEQRNILLKENIQLKKDFTNLNNAFFFAEKQINEMQQADSSKDRIIEGLKFDKEIIQTNSNGKDVTIKSLEKQVKRARNGTKWVAAGGIILTILSLIR